MPLKETMPTINYKKPMLKPLTNQELLTELERRIKAGTIKLEIDTKQIDNQNEEVPETKIFGLNKSTLLLGIVLVMGCLVFYRSSKTTLPVQIQTSVKIESP